MPCGCQKNQESFQVVTDEGRGRAVYTASSKTGKDTAIKVSARYPGSVVKNTKTGEIVHRTTDAAPKDAQPAG